MNIRNQANTDRALAFALVFVLLALTSCHQGNKAQIPATIVTSDTIVFEGTVEKLGQPSESGAVG